MLLLVTLAGAVGCRRSSSQDGDAPAADRRPLVTVSLPPQAWMLRQIAGDSIDINVLLTSGANPETYEPGVGVMRRAAASDLVMLSGNIGFEGSLADKLGRNNPGLRFVDTSRGIEPVYGTHSHGDHGHEAADPHTWTSVRNARVIVGNMLDALVQVDSANTAYYTSRADALRHRLDSIDAAVEARLADAPSRTFMVWHPSLSYLARDYGLQQVTVGSEGRESSVADIRSIIETARRTGAAVLFIQADYDSRQAATLSSQTGARVVTINPLDPDWESQINLIVDAIAGHDC